MAPQPNQQSKALKIKSSRCSFKTNFKVGAMSNMFMWTGNKFYVGVTCPQVVEKVGSGKVDSGCWVGYAEPGNKKF